MIFQDKTEFLKAAKGRLLGLDVGTKTIGLAITDDSNKISLPLDTIHRKGNKKDFPVLIEIIKTKKVGGLVVGLPLSFDGSETESSNFIRRFTNNFLSNFEIPIIFQDERLSSFEAEDLMLDEYGYSATKKVVDKIAASYILESFLMD